VRRPERRRRVGRQESPAYPVTSCEARPPPREIVTSAGFATLRRVAETPFNIVLEARA